MAFDPDHVAEVILLCLVFWLGFAIGYKLEWLTLTIVCIYAFVYFYPTIRTWFL